MQLDAQTLDVAVDRAARAGGAVVGEYVAAPTEGGVEVAVDCFVPPLDVEAMRRSLARRVGQTVRLHVVPPGTIHQWRHVWAISEDDQRRRRWSLNRADLDGVLHQAAHGWRELELV